LARNQFTENIMTIIFTIISVGGILVYIFNLIIMIKKGQKTEETVEKEFADDHLQRKGLQAFFSNFFAKIKILKMALIFVGCALVIVGASMLIAISTNWILTSSWG
jgi:hypothetical protein